MSSIKERWRSCGSTRPDRRMRTVILLIVSWGAGLAAYAGARKGWRGDVLSIDNWMLVGSITLVAWLFASVIVTLPVLRRLPLRRSSHSATVLLAATGAMLAIVPVWLTLAVWAGWHPRYLLSQEAGLLAVLYGTSGLVLGLSLGRID
jgi:hypothetical protein